MRSTLSVFLGLLLFTFGVYQINGQCSVSAVTTARNGGTYLVGNGVEQIYDVVVTNTGSCGANTIGLTITLPSGASISSNWNIQAGSSYYTVTNYGNVLPVGSSVNVGFIAFFPNTQTVPSTGVTVSVYGSACNQCTNPTTLSSSSSSASSSSSGTATATGTSSSGSSGGNCHVTATTTARNGGSWLSGNGISQIYDMVITNDGSCGVNSIIINLNLPAGATITSQWNINQNSGSSYTVTNFGSVLPIGNSVNAGIIVNFPNTQSVPNGVSATAATTTCNTCATGTSTSTGTGTSTSTGTGTGTSTGGGQNCPGLTVTLTPRANSQYPSQNGTSQLYDISIANNGACRVTSIVISINLPANTQGTITSSWNIQSYGNNYLITNYGGTLSPQQTATSGFIMEFSSTSVPSVTASLVRARCNC